MNIRNLSLIAAAGTFLAAGAQAQTFRRQASIVGGGDRDRGRCTVEVVVDGAAEIAFRGNDATVTNLKGQMPEMRRFECTSPIPPNAADLRFNGEAGRGHQELVGGPQGALVVRIEDPENGSDRYIFNLSWRTGGGPGYVPGPMTDRRDNRRFTAEQAVDTCRDAARRQVSDRFRTNDVNFRETRMDDAPGRGDWVIGTLEARHPGQPDTILKFSCSVDFGSGQVRSVDVQPEYREGMRGGGGDMRPMSMNPQAAQNCRRAVEERVRSDGYRQATFSDLRVDERRDRPGDWITGDVTAQNQYGPQTMRFSCSVDMRDGDVKSVDVNSRR